MGIPAGGAGCSAWQGLVPGTPLGFALPSRRRLSRRLRVKAGQEAAAGGPLANPQFHTIQGRRLCPWQLPARATSHSQSPLPCPALRGSRLGHCCSWPSGSTGPLAPCTENGPMHRMDRHPLPAPQWHHHRNGLKPVLLVSSYTNLTPPPLETAKAQLLGHTQHLLSPGQWVPQSCEGTGSLCPRTLGATVFPARLGAAGCTLRLAGARALCSPRAMG